MQANLVTTSKHFISTRNK